VSRLKKRSISQKTILVRLSRLCGKKIKVS
jgi:hypothetical protein